MYSKDYLLSVRKEMAQNSKLEHKNDKGITNMILEKATKNFFPKSGEWRDECFKRSKNLNKINLPCNLRDDLWLAKMLILDQKLFFLRFSSVLKFVKTSEYFNELRHQYEQNIVKQQINLMRVEEDFYYYLYQGDLNYEDACDIKFRKKVVDILSKIGIDREAIEEGLESNAILWRDFFMELAFENEFEPVSYSTIIDDGEMLPPADDLHREIWLKIRNYEYYQRHYESILKYGDLSDIEIKTEEEAKKLYEYLNMKNEERYDAIEQYISKYDDYGRSRKKK